MSKIKRFKLHFDPSIFAFPVQYPPDLHTLVSEEEFDGVLSVLNDDLLSNIKDHHTNLKKLMKTTNLTFSFLLGLLLTPWLMMEAKRQTLRMQQYWRNVKQYFSVINFKIYSRRGVEWRLLREERLELLERDSINPLAHYSIQITTNLRKIQPQIMSQERSAGILPVGPIPTSAHQRYSLGPEFNAQWGVADDAV